LWGDGLLSNLNNCRDEKETGGVSRETPQLTEANNKLLSAERI
jgi:hypothetical protein